MNQAINIAPAPGGPVIVDCQPPLADFAADVRAGMRRRQKAIPPKYFYDAAGSALFDAICQTPEYYVQRTELALLSAQAPALAGHIGAGAVVIEFGSGSAAKLNHLLRALPAPAAAVAIDISKTALRQTVDGLATTWPGLAVSGLCADFTAPLNPELLPKAGGQRVAFFPGSTIGNMAPDEATAFLRQARALLRPGDGFVLGVDLLKDPAILNAAYNDAAGLTAQFNRNLLHRINRELDGDIDTDLFSHRAFFNTDRARVEMHLQSLVDQRLRIAGETFAIRAGESIHTENSYKYSQAGFARLATAAGYRHRAAWQDPLALFSIHYLEPAYQRT